GRGLQRDLGIPYTCPATESATQRLRAVQAPHSREARSRGAPAYDSPPLEANIGSLVSLVSSALLLVGMNSLVDIDAQATTTDCGPKMCVRQYAEFACSSPKPPIPTPRNSDQHRD